MNRRCSHEPHFMKLLGEAGDLKVCGFPDSQQLRDFIRLFKVKTRRVVQVEGVAVRPEFGRSVVDGAMALFREAFILALPAQSGFCLYATRKLRSNELPRLQICSTTE
jgi:hypothetical protein